MNNAVILSETRLKLRKFFLKSEPVRGYTLLSPTLLAMILGLGMPLVVLFTLSFWLQEYLDFIRTMKIAAPRANVDGSLEGNLKELQIYTGNV